MQLMIGIACLVAGTTLLLTTGLIWLVDRQKPEPTPAELWAIHDNPMWG